MSKIKIIGAGIFGCAIAYELSRVGHQVTIYEKSSDIMTAASKHNHNRIHFGYHYPRSVETAKQSLDGMLSFMINHNNAIVSKFPNYYMIANHDSNVTSKQYKNFCNKVGINYRIDNTHLVNNTYIDETFATDEIVFDFHTVQQNMYNMLNGKVDIKFNTEFDGNTNDCDYVINTTYANLNEVNSMLGIPKIPIRYQDVIIPVFRYEHQPFGLTIMDGPFCSVMPQGKNECNFLLYHVKHSVISEADSKSKLNLDVDVDTYIETIYKESKKYYPFLKNVKHLDYYRTIRALPVNDNDARITEIFKHPENPNVISVLSGKVTTCHKIGIELANTL